jgi:hypothetical protein
MLEAGPELAPRIVERIKVKTPFRVEFAKYSRGTRAGAPTLTPVSRGGAPVNAIILVLEEGISCEEAKDMLWRRETGKMGTAKRYPAARSPRAVRVRTLVNFNGVASVLYTDFYANGKVRYPKPTALARRAIASVQGAGSCRDGISYLIGALEIGISTPLTNDYCSEILRITNSNSLAAALKALRKSNRHSGKRVRRHGNQAVQRG